MILLPQINGRQLDLLQPRAADVDPAVIAYAIARQPRFGGHTVRFYSVAEHSVLCARAGERLGLSRRLQLLLLLHDAHEGWLMDWMEPIVDAIAEILAKDSNAAAMYFRGALRSLKLRFDLAIYQAFAIDFPTDEEQAQIDAIDKRALRTERDALLIPDRERPFSWPHVDALPHLPIAPGQLPGQFDTPEHGAFNWLLWLSSLLDADNHAALITIADVQLAMKRAPWERAVVPVSLRKKEPA